MPANALPIPNSPLPGTVRFRRVYRDALGRPLTGSVTLLGSRRHDIADVTVLVAPAVVHLSDGVVEVNLPPDVYELSAQLKTVEGARLAEKETLDLTV